MTFRRYGNTDEQEEALAKVEDWAKKCEYRLDYGTSIGKSPQTVILDHHYQDGVVSVNRDGKIEFWGEEVWDFDRFKDRVEMVKED